MKIQIDTDTKTIRLDSKENLGKFISIIEKMVEDWRDYSIDTNTTIVWQNPVYVQYPYYTKPWYGYTNPDPLHYGNTGNSSGLTQSGQYANDTVTLNSKNERSTLLDGHDKTYQDEQKLYIKRNMKGTYNLEVN